MLELPFVVALGAFYLRAPVFGEDAAALGAGLGEGLGIDDKLTIRIIAATIEGALLFTDSLQQVTAALRTLGSGLYLIGLGILVLGILATGKELAETPNLDYHRMALEHK